MIRSIILQINLRRAVSYDEGVEYMKQENLDLFFETSAKTGDNIQKVFTEAAKQILERRKAVGDMTKPVNEQATKDAQDKMEINKLNISQKKSGKKGCC